MSCSASAVVIAGCAAIVGRESPLIARVVATVVLGLCVAMPAYLAIALSSEEYLYARPSTAEQHAIDVHGDTAATYERYEEQRNGAATPVVVWLVVALVFTVPFGMVAGMPTSGLELRNQRGVHCAPNV